MCIYFRFVNHLIEIQYIIYFLSMRINIKHKHHNFDVVCHECIKRKFNSYFYVFFSSYNSILNKKFGNLFFEI